MYYNFYLFIRLQLSRQEEVSQYDNIQSSKNVASESHDENIGMEKCQAYGEVGMKYWAGGNEDGGVYKHV